MLDGAGLSRRMRFAGYRTSSPHCHSMASVRPALGRPEDTDRYLPLTTSSSFVDCANAGSATVATQAMASHCFH